VNEWVLVGRVAGAHGIRGELKVKSETDFPERLTRVGSRRLVTARGEEQSVKLLGGRPHQGSYLVRLEGITDRNQAEALLGAQLFVPLAERPHLEAGEFLVSDLVGLEVRRLDTGLTIGTISDVINTGAQDLLVVQTEGQDILIPFVQALVPEVHADWVGVVPLLGLLEPDPTDRVS